MSEKVNFLYQQWLNLAVDDEDVVNELKDINGNETEVSDRFYKDLEFGTGGLRGKLGAGTNRMNIYTVRKTTLGLAAYLSNNYTTPSVAISYDSRRKSHLFAKETAQVFISCGIHVKMYDRLMPTPMLSFAIRHLECSAGVMITASHNPAEYNGYKVYGADGCQITDNAAAAITKCIASADPFSQSKFSPATTLQSSKLFEEISQSVIEQYYNAILTERVGNPKQKDLSIVYSPLHGSGLEPVMATLKMAGYTNIKVVPNQKEPNGNFPTCPYPNPELPEALSEGIKFLSEVGGDLLLATDPDCDRVGVVSEGYVLSGNEIGILLLDYICKSRIGNSTMPNNPIAIKTIVTTQMAEKVAKQYGVELINVLTGFKYIGEYIGQLEGNGEENRYIFGFEESCGYLSGTYARDKDAVNAVLLICDMAAHYMESGITLAEKLMSLYETHGFYECALDSFAFEGESGLAAMKNLTDSLRNEAPDSVFGIPAKKCIDYLDTAQTKGLPKSNVLEYTLTDNTLLTVRPSGTEPKMKIYYQVTRNSKNEAQKALNSLRKKISKLFQEA